MSEICRKLGKDSSECITVSDLLPGLFLTEVFHLCSLVKDELQAVIRVDAGSRILLCTAVGSLADSHRVHSYTEELSATAFVPDFELNNNQPNVFTRLRSNPISRRSQFPADQAWLSLAESQQPLAASSLQPTQSLPSPARKWLSEWPSRYRHILHALYNSSAEVCRSFKGIRKPNWMRSEMVYRVVDIFDRIVVVFILLP